VAKYSIRIKASAVKELNKIPHKDLKRIIKKVQDLAENPRPTGAEKLSGQDKYRIRQGNYRIVYAIEDDVLIVYIIKIAHRKDIYNRL